LAYAHAMHTKTLHGLSLLVLACAAGTPRAAEGTKATAPTYTNRDLGAAPSQTRGPVYTNADLERFGPPERTTSATRARSADLDEAAEWAFVQAALDREAERVAAERRYALELEAIRGGADPGDCGGGRGYISAPWVHGFGFGFGPDHRHDRSRIVDPFSPPARPPLREFLSRRKTLHGQPSAEQSGHGRHGRLKGSDAFPGGKAHHSGRSGSGKGGHGRR
jgi:hypothetical protein